MISCSAALAATGRWSVRTAIDTAIVMAPVVLFQILAFAVVFWTGPRPLAFSTALDRFFAGNWPLYLAVSTWGVFGAVVSPVAGTLWNERVGAAALALAMAWTIPLDFACYRDALARTRARATTDVAVQRAIAWTATVLYFVGTAAPKAATLPREIATVLFGARP